MQTPRASANTTKICGSPGQRERALVETGFDGFEIRALEVMRLIFAAMGKSRPRYAPEINAVANNLFGPQRGGIILAGLTAFVQTMAVSRSEKFRYSNPFCVGCSSVVTESEFHLVTVLHQMRRGHRGRAMTFALFLCDARPVSGLLDAAADLASLAPLATEYSLPPLLL